MLACRIPRSPPRFAQGSAHENRGLCAISIKRGRRHEDSLEDSAHRRRGNRVRMTENSYYFDVPAARVRASLNSLGRPSFWKSDTAFWFSTR